MPELPEVETTCRGIRPFAHGQIIREVIVRQAKLRWPISPSINKELSGQIIQSVNRRAKYLLLHTNVGDLMIHLGMSGSLRVVEGQNFGKHDHVDICLANGKIIRFNDPRRFGCIILNSQGEQHSLLKKLGPEPLSETFNTDYLYGKARLRRTPIKSFIMNNQIVVGVGNIYAQESLFNCGIHPNRSANKISRARIKQLVSSIKQILTSAIEAGGSSLKDFTQVDGKPGYFQQKLFVYGRHDATCLLCKTPLKKIMLAQRSSVYCPRCQR